MFTEKELAEKKPEDLVKIVLEHQKNIVTKELEIKNKQAEIELTAKVNEDLSNQVEALGKQIPAAVVDADSKTGISKETFVVDKKKYGFKKPRVHHRNDVITAAEVLASKDLQKELVAMQSGMIYLIDEVK